IHHIVPPKLKPLPAHHRKCVNNARTQIHPVQPKPPVFQFVFTRLPKDIRLCLDNDTFLYGLNRRGGAPAE
ncbi:MAG: hypothetical protein KAJ52_02360, partial [Sedimentisphaerales bacterium]|nr:hypothetical protein [Sedimentisphaerales bacterium]